MFNQLAFDTQFAKNIRRVQRAEGVTKEILKHMSRDVLEAVHCTEDSGYMNRLLDVVTPVNRKALVLFFKAFGGFQYHEETTHFAKKDKKTYATKETAAWLFLEDPLNNIWTWAERHIEVEQKAFDIQSVSKFIKAAIAKADNAGYTHADLIKAIFAGGLTVDELIDTLNVMETTTEPAMTLDGTLPE